MTDTHVPNAEQVRFWSDDAGPRWVAFQERSDAQLRPIGRRAMDAAMVSPGERILDVGAGCGDTTLDLAGRVGPAGHVHAIDVSAAMLDRARERVRAAHLANVTFQLGDPQAVPIEHGPHDVVFSRFGVMFFDDPRLAFARLREAARDGGRMAFCSWRSRGENEWLAGGVKIAARFVAMPPAPDPDAPGPFGLADRDRTLGILRSAGWQDVAIDSFDHPMALGGGGDLEMALDFLVRLGPMASALAEASAETHARLLDALREFLLPHLRPEGVVMAGATWVVTAHR